MDWKETRLAILQKVASGEIDAEEANRRIAELEWSVEEVREADAEPELPVQVFERAAEGGPEPGIEEQASFRKWKQWWMVPFWVNTGFLVLAVYLMVLGYQTSGLGVGFWLSFVFFLLSAGGMAIFFRARNARWLHIRVRQEHEKPHLIALSFPLPVRFIAWVMHTFRGVMPEHIRDGHMDEILEELDRSVTMKDPIHIKVDEEKDGETVEIFIG